MYNGRFTPRTILEETAMRGPKPTAINLTDTERADLEALVRRRSMSQQIATRARIILAAADGYNNGQIARALHIGLDQARHWRRRWLSLDGIAEDLSLTERLADLARPGAPVQITAEQVCQIVALACESPSDSERPISNWTGREIADEIVKRGILTHISARHASRLLKRGMSSRIRTATG
jgi:putative transposase